MQNFGSRASENVWIRRALRMGCLIDAKRNGTKPIFYPSYVI